MGNDSVRVTNRQLQLLGLVEALDSRVENGDFQKLLLIYCKQHCETPPYEFVPYKFGAFSFTSYSDRRKLVERGLLIDCEHHWVITPTGRRVVKKRLPAGGFDILREQLPFRGIQLDCRNVSPVPLLCDPKSNQKPNPTK